MSNEITVYETTGDIAVNRAPSEVLDEAKNAAKALGDVLKNKKKPVIMNDEQYLEFEDWQTVGRFYGVTAKEDGDAEPIELSGAIGFKANAVALRADGMVISRATAYCMNDESNWKSKPLFQLASMAQTRANSKVLRNVLAWVVVLAGYRPTPAEEMLGTSEKPPITEPQSKSKTIKDPGAPCTEPQVKAIHAMLEKAGYETDEAKFNNISHWLDLAFTIQSIKDLTKGQASQVIDLLNQTLKDKNAS